jgi:hypothetical protein
MTVKMVDRVRVRKAEKFNGINWLTTPVQCEPVSRGNNREKYRENPRPGPINCDLHPTCLDSSGLFASWRLEK